MPEIPTDVAKDINDILSYLWGDEESHYKEEPSDNHIFKSSERVDTWLNGGENATGNETRVE